MNMQSTNVMAPPPPKRIEEMLLPTTMMRDILLKTMFRKSIDMVSALANAICLPIPVTQELIDMGRDQRLIEATGTLNANNGNEMGYQLTDAGKQRALDALSQSEYYGAMPVPLEVYGSLPRLLVLSCCCYSSRFCAFYAAMPGVYVSCCVGAIVN